MRFWGRFFAFSVVCWRLLWWRGHSGKANFVAFPASINLFNSIPEAVSVDIWHDPLSDRLMLRFDEGATEPGPLLIGEMTRRLSAIFLVRLGEILLGEGEGGDVNANSGARILDTVVSDHRKALSRASTTTNPPAALPTYKRKTDQGLELSRDDQRDRLFLIEKLDLQRRGTGLVLTFRQSEENLPIGEMPLQVRMALSHFDIHVLLDLIYRKAWEGEWGLENKLPWLKEIYSDKSKKKLGVDGQLLN